MTPHNEEGADRPSPPTHHAVPNHENDTSVPASSDVLAGSTLGSDALATCPDCSGLRHDADRAELHHDPTCPAAASLAEVVADDRTWFAARPGARERRRPLTAAERVELYRLHGPAPEGAVWRGAVVVVQMAPGVRGRSFAGVSLQRVRGASS